MNMSNNILAEKRPARRVQIYKPMPKAKAVWRGRDTAKIRLLEGPVRSAKSYTANDLAIYEIQQLPPCDVLLSGFSISSVARNVLAEWKKTIDPLGQGLFSMVRDDKDEYLKINWRGLRNKKFYVRGAGKDNDYMQIQGATFGYWLADELTRHCESFTNMARTRLSLDWSKAIWTTNPDHPLHYVKRMFIDDPKLYEVDPLTGRSEMARWSFVIADNPSLSRSTIRSLSLSYTGVFKRRFIDGLWVMAEGAIYDFFDADTHTIADPPVAMQRYIGIDYGTNNPTCYIEFGRNDLHAKGEPRIWSEREYYFDSHAAGRQKDDAAYADDFVEFIGVQKDYDLVIYDPSALSLKLAIQRALARVGRSLEFKAADNDVVPGIKTQARMLNSSEYRVGKKCTQTISDYGAYVWDPNAALKKGVDAPLKVNDHTKDPERYVLHTLFGGQHIDYESALN
jgi:PBSX family phage terminase large subunit